MTYARTPHPTEDLRLEIVTVCVGFDDILDETLRDNVAHSDTFIVVTAHDDVKTQRVCRKHGVTAALTDLHRLDGAPFNRGAALNAGFDHFRFYGWRLHIDSDILLPRNFRRTLFNSCPIQVECIYGADRADVVGPGELGILRGPPPEDTLLHGGPEWAHREAYLVESRFNRKYAPRVIDSLRGWMPPGYFQLWHADSQRKYPHSLGTVAHDDETFASMWPQANRRLLPEVIVYHYLTQAPSERFGQDWAGRSQPRAEEHP